MSSPRRASRCACPEVLWRIGPLTLPGRSGLEDSEAARLFEARARQVSPTFAIEPGNAGAVADLCRRLDGIPLAIELAAARMETLSVPEVLVRLGDRLHHLAAEPAGEGRHRTLQAALDWGYLLLDDPERLLFRRLSVFAGSFELSTAEAVCSGGDLDALDIEGLVFSLVEHSLLQLNPTAGPTGTGCSNRCASTASSAWPRAVSRTRSPSATPRGSTRSPAGLRRGNAAMTSGAGCSAWMRTGTIFAQRWGGSASTTPRLRSRWAPR